MKNFTINSHSSRLPLFIILLTLSFITSGCAELGYYLQGAKGQLAIRSKEQPVERLLENPDTDQRLAEKLALSRDILDFARDELLLPVGKSYQTYADLNRSHVVWNIVATTAFDTTPKQWCFPIAGCVSYRGYFSRDEAKTFAQDLQTEGMDIHLYGVSAYSTLGWFDDPLLNTFIDYPEPELASLLFHELTHQLIYIKNDTTFNESFAEAVAREGVRRWLATRGDEASYAPYLERRSFRTDFATMVSAFRQELQASYNEAGSEREKRIVKESMHQELLKRYQALKEHWPTLQNLRWYDHIIGDQMNNARIAAIATYNDQLPAFNRLIKELDGDLPAFYRKVEELAEMDKEERSKVLR